MCVQVFSCSGIYASKLSDAVLADLRPPVIEDFKLSYTDTILVRTASENMTLYVSSGSVISIGSNAYDVESGIATCKVFLESTLIQGTKSALMEQLLYDGRADADIEVNLSKYELYHNLSYAVIFEASNRAGISTRVQAFVLLDESPPMLGIVLDGITELHVRCRGSHQMIAVNWTSFIDSETSIVFHQVAVVRTPHDAPAKDLLHVGLPLEPLQAMIELDGQNLLRPGDTIYVSVKATNTAGLSSVAVSDPLEVVCARHNCECSDDTICL